MTARAASAVGRWAAGGAGGLVATLLAEGALACPACFGAADASAARAMTWGVVTLAAIVLSVVAAFAAFAVRLARNEAATTGQPVEPARAAAQAPGPRRPAAGRVVEAGS
jgi:heme/copper-type cytochrome/quinol oxidase subunit 2